MWIGCKRHPKYRGQQEPKCDCVGCWAVWWRLWREQDWLQYHPIAGGRWSR